MIVIGGHFQPDKTVRYTVYTYIYIYIPPLDKLLHESLIPKLLTTRQTLLFTQVSRYTELIPSGSATFSAYVSPREDHSLSNPLLLSPDSQQLQQISQIARARCPSATVLFQGERASERLATIKRRAKGNNFVQNQVCLVSIPRKRGRRRGKGGQESRNSEGETVKRSYVRASMRQSIPPPPPPPLTYHEYY